MRGAGPACRPREKTGLAMCGMRPTRPGNSSSGAGWREPGAATPDGPMADAPAAMCRWRGARRCARPSLGCAVPRGRLAGRFPAANRQRQAKRAVASGGRPSRRGQDQERVVCGVCKRVSLASIRRACAWAFVHGGGGGGEGGRHAQTPRAAVTPRLGRHCMDNAGSHQ